MKVSKFLVSLLVLNLLITGGWVAASFYGMSWVILPQFIPFHWNIAGDVDAFAPRWALIILACIPMVIYFMMFLMPRIDPRPGAEEKHKGVFSLLVASFVIFFISMQWGVTAVALGLPLNMVSLLKILLGVIFLIMGILMGKIRFNSLMGIRTPWTLASEEVWDRTHRMGSWAFFFLGIWTLMLIFVPGILDYIFLFTAVLGVVGYLFYYSYREFKKRDRT